MPYQTDERLKSYLDTNQLYREQMCRAVLATDPRFSEVRPRHPRGGPDGGRDIEALYRGEQKAIGAVGFVNQANDSNEQKRGIESKFAADLESAVAATNELGAFVFFTNINLTIGEKNTFTLQAKSRGVPFCDIFDRERLRIDLDGPNGFFIRFQYLGIPLTEAEQASFFARWGDEIQSVISSGFDRMESALNRILFLQESRDPIVRITVAVELDRKYTAEEIGHFRFFCSLYLKEPKLGIMAILFGSSDKSCRMRSDAASDFSTQQPGIKYGISSGQWERHITYSNEDKPDQQEQDEEERYTPVGSSSSMGPDEIEFLSIRYDKDPFFRLQPGLALKDLDDSIFIFFSNNTLSHKIRAVHVYSNGYKLQEITELTIDESKFEPKLPVDFSEDELADPWVRIRPVEFSSAFHFRFFEVTPTRLFSPDQVKNSLNI
ncbi:hypothetical protein KBY66_03385 [Synechococcus sp. Tobar12-5m-g]|uniref:hypothetical protein n=1 Tax=unclassified Synechococcus TaxID=2626047 RepID=UPI0020CE6D14|nr:MULTISPECIES: hypothetical protein [unclassified Synechococcus]MCP9771669.1 hypothetical protein [Synechococcus sp. Tobar12-5m-g]MCP9872610.1 hypothetical protein [Synechococcus sp. Cruz CV-v-12]